MGSTCPWAHEHDAFALARGVRPGQSRHLAPPVGSVGKGKHSSEKNPYEGMLGPNVEESVISGRTYTKADISKLVKTPTDVGLPSQPTSRHRWRRDERARVVTMGQAAA